MCWRQIAGGVRAPVHGGGKIMRTSVVVGLFLALNAAPASASFDTGNELLTLCTSPDKFSQGMCYGLITGYFDAMRLSYTCPLGSAKITRQQLRDLVVKDLLADPARLVLPPHTYALIRLRQERRKARDRSANVATRITYSASHPSALAAARNVRQASISPASDAPAWLRACLATCQCGLFRSESLMYIMKE
jgi:Rap1a immunity proteins